MRAVPGLGSTPRARRRPSGGFYPGILAYFGLGGLEGRSRGLARRGVDARRRRGAPGFPAWGCRFAFYWGFDAGVHGLGMEIGRARPGVSSATAPPAP
jgi:hypothetical protein